jgi:hypothetical protein
MSAVVERTTGGGGGTRGTRGASATDTPLPVVESNAPRGALDLVLPHGGATHGLGPLHCKARSTTRQVPRAHRTTGGGCTEVRHPRVRSSAGKQERPEFPTRHSEAGRLWRHWVKGHAQRTVQRDLPSGLRARKFPHMNAHHPTATPMQAMTGYVCHTHATTVSTRRCLTRMECNKGVAGPQRAK